MQRDVLWGRHSHAWVCDVDSIHSLDATPLILYTQVINDPTWPVEWKQITPFLLWQDYMATGQTDLAVAFEDQAYQRTMIGSKSDALGGLLNTGVPYTGSAPFV